MKTRININRDNVVTDLCDYIFEQGYRGLAYANHDNQGFIFRMEDYDGESIDSEKIIAVTDSEIKVCDEEFDTYECDGWDVESLYRFETETKTYLLMPDGKVLGYIDEPTGEHIDIMGRFFDPN